MFITIGKQSLNVRACPEGTVSTAASGDVLWLVGSAEEVQEETELRKDRLHCCTGIWLLAWGPTTVSDTRVVPWQLSIDSGTHCLPPLLSNHGSPHTPRDRLGEKPGKTVGMRQIEQVTLRRLCIIPRGRLALWTEQIRRTLPD